MIKIDYHKNFLKQYKKAPISIQERITARLEIFKKDPFDPRLNNHTLTGNYRGYRSINITGDWRAIYTENQEETIFVTIGTHSQLYG